MEKQYRVIKPYRSAYGHGITLPAGTILTWWAERGFFLSEPVDGVCVPVSKWAVEAWHDYFEPAAPSQE